jgi:hypothetical protein
MEMSHWLRTLAVRFLAISLLAATLYAVDSLASPSPAQARCMGVNNPVYSWFAYSGAVRVSETPAAGTCNGNNTYTGVLKDERQDGYCVSVKFRETGTTWIRVGYVCGAGSTDTFEWNDLYLDNSRAYQQLCVHRASDGVEVACGWGNDNGGWDTNWGY